MSGLAPRGARAGGAVDAAAVQRRVLVVLIITQVVGTIGVGIAPSIGVLLADEVMDNEIGAGLARTASTLGAALAGVPLGNLAARSGRRAALASGWWIAAAGSAVLIAAAQFGLVVPLFAGLLMIGTGSAVSLQSRFAATDLAEPHRRGRSLALVVWVGTLGSVLGPNLGVPGGWVGAATGLNVYAGAFLIAAVCLALAGVVVQLALRPDPLRVLREIHGAGPAPTGPAKGRIARVVAELRTNAQARFAFLAIITAQIVMVSVMTMTPVHLAHQGGSITLVGITISLHVVGMYSLAPVVGIIADRAGARLAIGIGLAVLTASLVIGAARPDQTGWIIASLMLLGVGWSFVNVSGSALFSAVISDDTRASSQGGVDALSNLCGAAAALVAGPLLMLTSFSTLSIVAIVVLLPLAALTVRRPRTPRD